VTENDKNLTDVKIHLHLYESIRHGILFGTVMDVSPLRQFTPWTFCPKMFWPLDVFNVSFS